MVDHHLYILSIHNPRIVSIHNHMNSFLFFCRLSLKRMIAQIANPSIAALESVAMIDTTRSMIMLYCSRLCRDVRIYCLIR